MAAVARTLAQAYVFKAAKRLKVLDVLLAEESFSDVVREAPRNWSNQP